MLKKDVADGRIGDIRFIEASARSTVVDQGVHVLELALSYNGFSKPVRTYASVSGAEPLEGRQPSPDMAEAIVEFENGVRSALMCGEIAPEAIEGGGRCAHKRVAAYGTKGFVHWWMHGWERGTAEGGLESGEHSYGEQDVRAQAGLTDAAFQLAAGEIDEHPTGLQNAGPKFNAILGMYVSALRNAPVELPFGAPDNIIEGLKTRLS